MSPEDLRSWRKSLGLSQEKAAGELGIGRRTIQDYEGATYPIPPHIALACSAISAELPPWSEKFVYDNLAGLKFYPASEAS